MLMNLANFDLEGCFIQAIFARFPNSDQFCSCLRRRRLVSESSERGQSMPKCRIIPRRTPVSRLPGQRDCPIVKSETFSSRGEVKICKIYQVDQIIIFYRLNLDAEPVSIISSTKFGISANDFLGLLDTTRKKQRNGFVKYSSR